MRRILELAIKRWADAGLMDAKTAEGILAFEKERSGRIALRWPVLVAWSFGGIMLAAGILLFISANWDAWSPAQRFSTVLAGVALFHLAGAAVAKSQPILARILHAVGTLACGGGIFLAGQIFNLSEHWPGAFLLWSLAALAAWLLLNDWVQAALASILLPIWLIGEWTELTRFTTGGQIVAPASVALLALIYFTLPSAAETSPFRSALCWIGGLAFFPAMVTFGHETTLLGRPPNPLATVSIDSPLVWIGWTTAIAAALALSFVAKRQGAWVSAVAVAWVVILAQVTFSSTLAYLLCGLGAFGLIWWGMREERKERVNFGVAGFGLTVLFFYFSNVMDKLNRSLGLVVFGALLILLGFALTRLRGKLMEQWDKEVSS